MHCTDRLAIAASVASAGRCMPFWKDNNIQTKNNYTYLLID